MAGKCTNLCASTLAGCLKVRQEHPGNVLKAVSLAEWEAESCYKLIVHTPDLPCCRVQAMNADAGHKQRSLAELADWQTGLRRNTAAPVSAQKAPRVFGEVSPTLA